MKYAPFIIENHGSQTWIVDSGASSHIANNKILFTKINNTEKKKKTTVVIVNGNILKSYGSGEAIIMTKTPDRDRNKITLKNVLYVPDLKSNVISVSKITQNWYKLVFEKEKCMLSCNGKTYLEAKKKNNLYEVELQEKISQTKWTSHTTVKIKNG